MSEAAGSERTAANEKSFGETMTTGEAAKVLGVSVATVRRMCDGDQLRYWQTDPAGTREDVRGHTLRGHRRVVTASVFAARDAMRNPTA